MRAVKEQLQKLFTTVRKLPVWILLLVAAVVIVGGGFLWLDYRSEKKAEHGAKASAIIEQYESEPSLAYDTQSCSSQVRDTESIDYGILRREIRAPLLKYQVLCLVALENYDRALPLAKVARHAYEHIGSAKEQADSNNMVEFINNVLETQRLDAIEPDKPESEWEQHEGPLL